MKITITLPSGGGDHEDHGDVIQVLPAAGVPGRPVDERGNDLNRREPEGGDPQTGIPM